MYVSRTKILDKDDVIGFLHCARKTFPYCVDCMKKIKKGQLYVIFRSILMAKEKIHLDCIEKERDNQFVVVSSKKHGYWKHECMEVWKARPPKKIEIITPRKSYKHNSKKVGNS